MNRVHTPVFDKTEKAKRIVWSIFESMLEKEQYFSFRSRLLEAGIATDFSEEFYSKQTTIIHFKGDGIVGKCDVSNKLVGDNFGDVYPANITHLQMEVSKELYNLAVDFAKTMPWGVRGQATPFRWIEGRSFGLKGTLIYAGSNLRVSFESSFLTPILGPRIIKFYNYGV